MKNTASRSMKIEKTSPGSAAARWPARSRIALPSRESCSSNGGRAGKSARSSAYASRIPSYRSAYSGARSANSTTWPRRAAPRPADSDEDRERCEVDQRGGQPERQAKASVQPLARPRQRRGQEHAHEEDEEDVADHEQQEKADNRQAREHEREIDRQRPVDKRLTRIARRHHPERIPIKRRR